MPRKTNKKRKTYRKRRRKKNYSMPIGGFPATKTVKLRWCSAINLNPGSGSYTTLPLKINDLTQINDLLTVAQNVTPGNYSKWISMYQRYTVMGARVKVRYTPMASESLEAQVVPGYLGIYTCSDRKELDDILVDGVANLFEQPRNNLCRYLTGSQLRDGILLTKNWSAAKFFQVSKRQLYSDQDTFSSYIEDPGTTGEEQVPPSVPAYIIPYIAAVGGNNPGPIQLLVTIDFVVRFSGKKQNASI